MYAYVFPRVIHIDMFSLREQLKHIDSEVAEVSVAYTLPYMGEVGVELYDVIHSVETGLRMMEEHFGLNVRALEYPRPASPEMPLYHQLRRLSSSADLIRQFFDGNSAQDVAMALLAVIGNAESALTILARVYHVDVDACRRDVFIKNDRRGYYVGVPRDADGWLPGYFAMHNLAQKGCPEGAHSGQGGSDLPASPSLPQKERELSNSPEGVTAC